MLTWAHCIQARAHKTSFQIECYKSPNAWRGGFSTYCFIAVKLVVFLGGFWLNDQNKVRG